MNSSAKRGTDSTFARIETRLIVLTLMVGGLYIPALFSLWLLRRVADQVGALGP